MENEIEKTTSEVTNMVTSEETAPNETKADCDINRECSQIMNEFMQIEQESLNRQNNLIQRLEYFREQTGREDIAAVIQEVKDLIIGDETEHWDVAKSWYEFFAGIEPKQDATDDLNPDLEEDGEDVEYVLDDSAEE